MIQTFGLTKYYGSVRGIEGLDLKVEPGEIFGFLGPNGAGKTTTIRLLMDFIRPTAGRAEIFGLEVRTHSREIRRRVGSVSGDVALYESLKGRELLDLTDRLHGRRDPGRRWELAERLGSDLDRPIKTLSKGNRQKVALIQALAHDPELLILDEPMSGLDPLVQAEFLEILREARSRGRSVFLSSHMLTEVEHVCDRVGIVREGLLVAVEEVADLKHKRVRRMEVTLAREARPGDFAQDGVQVLRCEGAKAELVVSGGLQPLLARLAALPVENLVFPEASLEDTFMSYYSEEAREDEPGAAADRT